MFRYGVIGAGMMGREHILNVEHLSGAVVTAFSDTNVGSRELTSRLVPSAIAFADHRELLASGLVDAIVIATPNHTHLDILRDVLATDLHVLVEKPLATTLEDCRTILALAEQRKAVTWVGLEYRYMPPITRLIDEVHGGAVGNLRMLAIREHRFPFLDKVNDWNRFSENTGGTLVEKCCHFFDLMNHIVGDAPLRVMASGGQDVNHLDERYDGRVPDILDNAYVIVEYPGGVRAMLDICMFAEATHNQEELTAVGDIGKVEALIPDMEVRIGRRGEHHIGSVEHHAVADDRITYEGHHHGSSQLEHMDFMAACRGEMAPKVSLQDGLLSVAVGIAAHRSIDEGRWVRMAEVLDS